MKPVTFTLTLSLIRCHWSFHRIFNPGINFWIPGLQNPNPEIAGLGSGPGIANTNLVAIRLDWLQHSIKIQYKIILIYITTVRENYMKI